MSLGIPADVLAKANESNQKRWRWIVRHVYGRILDCGSGSGETWKQTGYPMDNVVCIDLACYRWIPHFVWGDVHHLPFKDETFDTVVCSEILEHAVDPERVLAEAARVCRGRIVITIPDEYNWDPAVKPFMTWEDHVKGGELEQLKRIPSLMKDISEFKFRHHWHLRQFKEEEIKALLEEAALQIRIYEHRVEDLKPYAYYFIVLEE